MNIIQPITLTDASLISSNLVEDLPYSSSGTSYNLWSASTVYASTTVVCWAWTQSYIEREPFQIGVKYFAVFTSAYSSNLNREPGKIVVDGGATQPQGNYWTVGTYAAQWDAATTYGLGAIVGRVNGSTGAFYQSLQANNTNHDPISASTYWRQMTADTYSEWSSGTTYGNGERVCVTGGGVSAVYTSLQASNLNHTPASSPTWWQYNGDSYKTYNAATTYAAGDMVLSLATHHVYESAVSSNTGHDPTNSANVPTYWLDAGASNRWAMFDQVNSSQSLGNPTIDVTVAPGQNCDSLALLNMEATSVAITATHGGVTVYSQTFTLSDPSYITDWRHYFFDASTQKSDLIINDLPIYTDLQVRIVITNSAGQAKCGTAVFGLAQSIGATVYGAESGILNFSQATQDSFGNVNLVRRTNSRRMNFKIVCTNTQKDAVYNTMVSLLDTPCVFQGTADYASLWVYGFYSDFTLAHEYVKHSYLSLEIKGLT